ncbi:MAG: T9SS type A sorting domain-containing protein [Ignavibacteria bacterium]
MGLVTIKVYNAVGREVVTLVNEVKEPGYYTIKFNAANLASGVYFYRMTAGDFSAVKKFILLK